MAVPERPKLYHICHVDRLPSIIASGGLLSDAAMVQAAAPGTVIGMNRIKQRRMTELQLTSHPGLYVGQGKQAEFLLEQYFPWHLIERIGVLSQPLPLRSRMRCRWEAIGPRWSSCPTGTTESETDHDRTHQW